jgi:hypothetical protein
VLIDSFGEVDNVEALDSIVLDLVDGRFVFSKPLLSAAAK